MSGVKCQVLSVMCQVSGVKCQVSSVTCNMSQFICKTCQVSGNTFFSSSFFYKVVRLVGEGYAINGACLSSLLCYEVNILD